MASPPADTSTPAAPATHSLEGADLRKTNLAGAALAGANLRRANLAGATLTGANLTGANLVDANVEGGRLANARLDAAHLECAALANADLGGADLAGSVLFRADLTRANLAGSNLSAANLYQATLGGADLTRAHLERANLQGAALSRAELTAASLAGVDAAGADFSDSRLVGAGMQGAKLKEANLSGADLTAADLTGADLSGAGLHGARIDRAVLHEIRYDARTRWPEGFDPAPYQHLDAGRQLQDSDPLELGEEGPVRVRVARRAAAEDGSALQVERLSDAPTIAGVELAQLQTFANERRVLMVSFNANEPAGTLGYTVLVRPGCSVGDHFHHRREERITLLQGRVAITLQDRRLDSPTHDLLNLFTADRPGLSIRIPTGVAHALVAEGGGAVLQVLASMDYDPADDVHVVLPHA